MLFASYEFFLFFIAIFPLAIFLKQKVAAYKVFLLGVNLAFYSFWGYQFIIVLLVSLLVNYLLIQGLSITKNKTWYYFGLVFNLAYLGVFKYFNFFAESLFQIFNRVGLQPSFSVIQIIAPVGISFYTFRLISHLVDYEKGKFTQPHFLDYFVYVTYFPQILAGPIARAKEFYLQLNFKYKYEYQTEEVIVLVLSGLFKKYALSSFLFEFSRLPFRVPQDYSSQDLILAAIAYSCLIYVDFSGYSDLANALSCVLGFQPIQNFNMPYQSLSIREFWRRWHISLSEFLRDYVYIPLGGSQQGEKRKYLNLILTMLLGGFWHGAGLNFIVWGGIHGVGLVLNHGWATLQKSRQPAVKQESPWFEQFLMWLLTFSFVTVSWIFFNTDGLDTSFAFIHGIFFSDVTFSRFDLWQLYGAIALVFLLNFYGDSISQTLTTLLQRRRFSQQIAITAGFTYVILNLGPETIPPFIYFGF